jgi:uncharacterized protein (UPF0335 family)
VTERTLGAAVEEAVAALLADLVEIAPDEVALRLPEHIRRGRPSKKSISAAVVAAGWRRVRKGDSILFRAPQEKSDPLSQHGQAGDNIATEQLRLLIERIERLTEEKQGIADDIKDVFAEAKSTGFDTKTIRAIVKLRGMEKHTRDEAEMLLDLYKSALGLD